MSPLACVMGDSSPKQESPITQAKGDIEFFESSLITNIYFCI